MAVRGERNSAASRYDRKIRIEERFAWAHHRTGWEHVERAVERALAAPHATTLFVGAVEHEPVWAANAPCRLVEIIGDLMGMEDFHALEYASSDGRCFIYREDGGDIAVLKSADPHVIGQLRDRLGL